MLEQIKTQLDSIDEKGIEILRVAKNEFTTNGYYNSNIQAIADKVGIGKGSVYRRFSSKQILFLSIIEYGYRAFYQEMEGIDKTRGFKSLIEQFMTKTTYYIYENSNIMNLAHMEQINIFSGIQEEVFIWLEQMMAPMISFWEEAIMAGQTEKALRKSLNPKRIGRIIMPMLHAVFHTLIIHKRNFTEKDLTNEGELLIDTLLNGLLK